MNYLAHAFLSFRHPEILVGNMISDFVKGRKKDNYEDLVQKGIMLHRSIDSFTDLHEATSRQNNSSHPITGCMQAHLLILCTTTSLPTTATNLTRSAIDFSDKPIACRPVQRRTSRTL